MENFLDILKNIINSKQIKFILIIYVIISSILILINRAIPTPDTIIFFILILSVVFNKSRKFIKDWWFLFAFFYLYEFTRGHANWLQKILNIETNNSFLLKAEELIFGENIPTIVFQSFTSNNVNTFDVIAIIMYLSFFIVPISTGILVWLKGKLTEFKKFKLNYIFLTFSSLITFIFFPAAPPWMASDLGLIQPLVRNSWDKLHIGQWTSDLFSSVGYNPVAPFPSLHLGWAFLTSYTLDQFLKSKIGVYSKISYLYTIIMSLSIIYTGDHYVVDILGGILYTCLSILIVNRIFRSEKRL